METLNARQMIAIIVNFMLGSALIVGVATNVGQDSWIPLLIALAVMLPFAVLYGRIIKLFPGKDCFALFELCFGKIGSRILDVLVILYALQIGATMTRTLTEFTQIVSLPETPQLPVLLIMLCVATYAAKRGIGTIGKWAVVTLCILALIMVFTVSLAISHFNYDNFLPLMEHSLPEIGADTLRLASSPFLETLLILGLAGSLRVKSPGKVYLAAYALTGLFLLLILLRNIGLLGVPLLQSVYFSSYSAARIVQIGTFLTRIESTISVNFYLVGFTKMAVCIVFAAKGLAHLTGIKDYKNMVVPIGLLMMALAAVLFGSTMEMVNFTDNEILLDFPFEVAVTLLLWIAVEIKARKKRAVESA